MSDETAFLRAIEQQPRETTPRQLYADWLEEQGDGRGELIRIAEQMQRLPATSNRFWELKNRRHELQPLASADWLQHLGYIGRRPPLLVDPMPRDWQSRWRLIREWVERWFGWPMPDVGGRRDEVARITAKLPSVMFQPLPAAVLEWIAFALDVCTESRKIPGNLPVADFFNDSSALQYLPQIEALVLWITHEPFAMYYWLMPQPLANSLPLAANREFNYTSDATDELELSYREDESDHIEEFDLVLDSETINELEFSTTSEQVTQAEAEAEGESQAELDHFEEFDLNESINEPEFLATSEQVTQAEGVTAPAEKIEFIDESEFPNEFDLSDSGFQDSYALMGESETSAEPQLIVCASDQLPTLPLTEHSSDGTLHSPMSILMFFYINTRCWYNVSHLEVDVENPRAVVIELQNAFPVQLCFVVFSGSEKAWIFEADDLFITFWPVSVPGFCRMLTITASSSLRLEDLPKPIQDYPNRFRGYGTGVFAHVRPF